MEKNEPCPLCGGEVSISEGQKALSIVFCPSCKVKFIFPQGTNVVELWNKRNGGDAVAKVDHIK